MNNEGENIIDEYLVLVREKLPESIADDVINELRSYMYESARDYGDGEITVQSAKKVVAQFGAPGEVADEYKYSMLPETTPEEAIPMEIAQELPYVPLQEPLQKSKPRLTPIPNENPTVSSFSFFLKTSIQSWIWVFFASLLTLIIGPIGIPLWTLLIPVSQAALVTFALLLHSLNLKWNKTLLWRRAYREWSALQNFVTLPENSIPERGINVLRLDALISFIGIVLFLSASLFGNNFSFLILCGVPVCFLLGARIYYRAVTFRDDKDPIRNSRKQFVINLALLLGLNASAFWIFNYSWYYYSFIANLSPLLLSFILGYGTIVLFNIVTGTQNLWWKTEDRSGYKQMPKQTKKGNDKKELIERFPTIAGRVYANVVLWIIVFNAAQIYLSATHVQTYMYYEFPNRLAAFFIAISASGLLLIFYFLYRYIMIRNFNFVRVIGQRTRIEALVDGIVSSLFLLAVMSFIFFNLGHIFKYNIIYYQEELDSFQLGYIVGIMEGIPSFIICVGLTFRLFGDAMEFTIKWKRGATRWIKLSGILLVFSFSIIGAVDYFKYITMSYWYDATYWLFLPLVLFFAFQVGTSSIKLKMMKRGNHNLKTLNPKDTNYSIAN